LACLSVGRGLMDADKLRALLKEVAGGGVSPDEALARLKSLPFEDLGIARVDHHRGLRTGAPEVVFCQGKRPEDAAAVFSAIVRSGATALATRAAPEHWEAVRALFPEARYDDVSRTILLSARGGAKSLPGYVCVVAAGTADAPVAEEAAVTAEAFGSRVERLCDVGVAGLHRLLACIDVLSGADALVVVAGMEGALPSVVGGLVEAPVVAVPTSVGYGASFGGLAALLGMLNSCAAGVVVVNIDNGFGGGYAANLIHRRTRQKREER